MSDPRSGSNLPTRHTLPHYVQKKPAITVTIPHSHHVSRGLDPVFDISSKFDALEVAPQSDEQETKILPVDIPPPATSFSEIGFSAKALIDNVRRCGYVDPTPIQSYAIPVAIAGRDLMACGQTGSDKTAAFCLPIIDGVMLVKQRRKCCFPNYMTRPLALILASTRDLACQIHEEAKKFSYGTGVNVVAVHGGVPIEHQLRNLERGVDILVATPGCLVDMIERAKVSLKNIRYLAIDEADRLLDMGLGAMVRNIVQQREMPLRGSRQTMLFSTTFSAEIQRLASEFLSNYVVFLAAGSTESTKGKKTERYSNIRFADIQ